ncbi:MAG: TetM/TetW/TetO/TetS family tetracycline resistance ribosomal protection protein, partial [Clostridia bacterium]|nr:TetM/TetW/TetO/TetS family tetracycline resistance ribosomal protection protein [Clostridia bacterium]
MKKISAGILAHVDSGKTTLTEALMYCSGNLGKLGRVDHKNSFLDTFSIERERGITVFSKQAVLKYDNTEFTLIDTPGHIDFSAETERTLRVLDYAILVISGSEGVQSHTYTLWKLLKKYNIPCFIFVNKMDLSGADKDQIITQLKNKLSDGCVDFENDSTLEFYENIALCDDKLFDEYENNLSIKKSDIISAIKERKLFPCMFGSALKLDGAESFLKCLSDYTLMPEYGKDFGARVFKISEDPRGSRLTFLKITGGTLNVKEILKSDRNIAGEKVNQIRIYSGEKFVQTESASAGTVCAVTGISFAKSGDGLGFEKNSSMPVLSPVLTYKAQPPKGTDVHTLLEKFKILEEEDPTLNVIWNERLKEIQVQLMGDIQLEILQQIFLDRFGIEVAFGKGAIIYKETISHTVEGIGHFEPLRHYAEVHLILKPGKRDSGIVITSKCKEDILDKNWQRLIMTHLAEKTHIGVLTGSPITDIEIELVSGRAHPKHTEGGDFRQATYRAVRQGLRSADCVLLEPFYEFMLEIPNENVGRAMTDIQRMSGSFDPPETAGDFTVIKGSAPVSQMSDYTKDVIQYTHGKGRLVCNLKGYEPCCNADEIINKIGYDPDSDTDNPCDSVFCSHGAGHTVKWSEVESYMHMPAVLVRKSYETGGDVQNLFSRCKSQNDVFALDKELMQIFEQTYGKITKRTENSKRHFEAKTEDKDHYKRKQQINYSGEEYLLVDGYNVIFSWDNLKAAAKDSIDAARNMLINILCNYQGYKKCRLILVFDAYKVKGNNREIETVGNINVVYTKEAETADMYIEK